MSDYRRTKPNIWKNYPAKASSKGVAGFSRTESLLSVSRLKTEYLFGIPLVSPITRERMSDEVITAALNRGIARVELECRIDVTPVQRVTNLPFDRTKYLQGWNQIDLSWFPIHSVEELSIRGTNSRSYPDNPDGGDFGISPDEPFPCDHLPCQAPCRHLPCDRQGCNHGPWHEPKNRIEIPGQQIEGRSYEPSSHGEGTLLYNVPLQWLDLSLGNKGFIHMVPLISSFTGTGLVGAAIQGPAAALFMVFNQLPNIPAYWFCKWTSGFDENAIPVTINDLIGCYATLEILSLIGPLRPYNSQSIGLDGASQGVSGPGPALYKQRVDELNQRISELKDIIKARFTAKLIMSHI